MPGLVAALEQREFAQRGTAFDHAMLLDEIGTGNRHQPVVEQLLAVRVGIIAAPEANRNVILRAREIHHFARGMKAQFDVGVLAAKRADPGQQPDLQE
jgi:hypothetical protein